MQSFKHDMIALFILSLTAATLMGLNYLFDWSTL